MKLVAALVIALSILTPASAQYLGNSNRNSGGMYGNSGMSGTGSNPSSHYSSGYTTQSGTYVQPYRATSPNNTQLDNYSTRGNINPYTGAAGTRGARY